jgi:hypothetical protein
MPVKSQRYKDEKYNQILNYVVNKDGTLLTKEYINCEQYFTVRCEYGHEWSAPFTQFVSKNTWCQVCHVNKQSILLTNIAKQNSKQIQSETQRTCKKCNLVKPKEEFCKLNSTAYSYMCKDCFNENRSSNRNDYFFKTLNSFITHKIANARKRAKKKNINFDLDIEFIINLYEKQNGLCALSKETLTFERNNFKNLSIDRVNSSKGYTKDNVQLVCEIVNCMKLDLNVEDFILFCKKIVGN